jgi:hypothetical protein
MVAVGVFAAVIVAFVVFSRMRYFRYLIWVARDRPAALQKGLQRVRGSSGACDMAREGGPDVRSVGWTFAKSQSSPGLDSWALSTVRCEASSSHRSWAKTSGICSSCVRERGRGRMSTESVLRLASR